MNVEITRPLPWLTGEANTGKVTEFILLINAVLRSTTVEEVKTFIYLANLTEFEIYYTDATIIVALKDDPTYFFLTIKLPNE